MPGKTALALIADSQIIAVSNMPLAFAFGTGQTRLFDLIPILEPTFIPAQDTTRICPLVPAHPVNDSLNF